MAVTMGGVSSALVGFNNSEATTEQEQLISKRTIDIITCIYTPIAMLIMGYGLFTFEWRSQFMRKKQVCTLTDALLKITACFSPDSHACLFCCLNSLISKYP